MINHKDYNVYKKSKSKDSCGLASTSNPAGGLMGRGGQGGLFGNSAFWMSLPRFSRAPWELANFADRDTELLLPFFFVAAYVSHDTSSYNWPAFFRDQRRSASAFRNMYPGSFMAGIPRHPPILLLLICMRCALEMFVEMFLRIFRQIRRMIWYLIC